MNDKVEAEAKLVACRTSEVCSMRQDMGRQV